MSQLASRPAAAAALVMAFDSAMMEQARQCISTIRAHCRYQVDLCVVAIDLSEAERAELSRWAR